MLEWRVYRDSESVFWNQFKKDGDIGLVTKFKGGGDGYKPENLGPFTLENYEYRAKEIKGNKGTFWVIERRAVNIPGEKPEEQIAHESTNNEYAKRQAHIDELAERKLAILERIALSLEKLATCVSEKDGIFYIRNARDLDGE